jgi:hypothetical protein
MQMKRIEKTGAWEIAGSKEELPQIGKFLQAAAFEGVGAKEKKLSLSVNGHKFTPESNRELWMFGYGLEIALSPPKEIEPEKKKVEKEKVRVASEKKEETPFTEWDKDFAAAVTPDKTQETKT